jgi:serine/threonine-protein kinase
VSPQNILISNTGSTVIIDFGVAKARDRVSQETSAGQLKGKIRYMAPEQALGRTIDHRADVWALGAILYELFAGVPPYDGPNEVATLHKLTSGEIPAPLPPHVPQAVRNVIDRALAYDAEERYATALELNLALETAMVEIGEATSIAVVAHYTAQLLADRKASRKRAVDAALAAAHARDGRGGRPSTSASVPSTSSVPIPPSSTPSLSSGPRSAGGPSSLQRPSTVPPYPVVELAPTDLASTPSGSVGNSDVPSATSSATLGSAAMEYPPAIVDDPARKRRFFTAVALGVSLAAGVIGAVLIISTAVLKRSTDDKGAGAPLSTAAALNPTPPPPPESEPTPEPPPDPATATATSTSAKPTPATTATPVTPVTPVKAAATVNPPASAATPTSPPSPPTPAPHKPQGSPNAAAPGRPKPPPTSPAAPQPTGKDRGF